MSQTPDSSPWADPEFATVSRPSGSNGLGIAGFIVSLLGPCTCGVLSPIGLVLSSMALFRPPRGFAIAGTVLGVLGTVLLSVAVVGLFQFSNVTGIGVLQFPTFAQTSPQMIEATEVIDDYYSQQNALPDEAEGQRLLSGRTDVWGAALRYRRLDANQYAIVSAGPDGQFDTDDDLSLRSQPHQWAQAVDELRQTREEMQPPGPASGEGESEAPEPAAP